MVVLAIDIGGTQYRLAVVDDRGNILAQHREKTERLQGAPWLIPRLVEGAHDLVEEVKVRPRAIGVGFGGPVDYKEQRILASLHAPGWEQTDLGSILHQEFKIPVVIDNDANLGAYGEFIFGAGRGYHNLLYYTVSTGVGGGVIIDGQLFRGVHGQAGELGHIPIMWDGPPCTCGYKGCVESLCSGLAIAQRALEAIKDDRNQPLAQHLEATGSLAAKDVFEYASLGDPLAKKIVEEVKDLFVMALIGAVNVFDPEVVVVGGGVGSSPTFVEGMTARVNGNLVIPGRRAIPCVRSVLGDDSVLCGATALAWDLVNKK